jgi:hypothetical protein
MTIQVSCVGCFVGARGFNVIARRIIPMKMGGPK